MTQYRRRRRVWACEAIPESLSASSLGSCVPREILDLIQSSALQSPVVRASHNIMTGKDGIRRTLIERLEKQFDFLYKAVHRVNEYFWPRFC
jgi:hypothetical protein